MSLMSLSRFLADKKWRESLSMRLKDDIVKRFWTEEFAILPQRLAYDSLAPIQNKVGALIANPTLRSIFEPAKSKLQLSNILRNNKILLVNLSRGLLGLDGCVLLGSMLLSLLESVVLSRAELPENSRAPFFLYVDEFSLFANDGFVALLAEGRKYGLGVTLAQQGIASLDPKLQSDILTNTGTLISFRLGAHDAHLVEQQLQPIYQSLHLMTLPAHQFAIRILIDGMAKNPFNGKTCGKGE